MINYVIGSPVYASQWNAIVERLARVGAQSPWVATHNVISTLGYQYTGQKVSSTPTHGGMTYLGTNMWGPQGNTTLCVVLPQYYGSQPGVGNVRTAYQCSTRLKAKFTAGGSGITDDIAPEYGTTNPEMVPPHAHIYRCNVASKGSGNYGLCHVLLSNYYHGTYGYEQDVSPFVAWIQWSGIPGALEG